MRDIKFRGLSTKENKWVYGNIQTPKPPFDKYFMWDDENNQLEVIPESVGQFTGLFDKNRKEIYEGDICDHLGEIAKIAFWEGAFIFDKYYIHEYALTNFACCRTFEIIGNIQSNPELLK